MTIRSFFDQIGNQVSFTYPPKRIVSLVPSQTELLADLGLESQLVGITKHCIHPPGLLRTKTIIGGTKNFQIEIIDDLKPDLIIGNKEENYVEGIEQLKRKHAVWLSDIVTVSDAYSMISSLGELTNTEEKARLIKDQIAERFQSVKKKSAQSVLYLIWRKPWMAAAAATFIDSILTMLNLKNALEGVTRYPQLSTEQIADLRPDFIFLSSEPYPFREKHIDELKKISPSSRVMLVDGEMFSWYGSRLLKAADYFNHLSLEG
jgi:ABC-type Fe3+-hydroxamate transport system substrate-binding protein